MGTVGKATLHTLRGQAEAQTTPQNSVWLVETRTGAETKLHWVGGRRAGASRHRKQPGQGEKEPRAPRGAAARAAQNSPMFVPRGAKGGGPSPDNSVKPQSANTRNLKNSTEKSVVIQTLKADDVAKILKTSRAEWPEEGQPADTSEKTRPTWTPIPAADVLPESGSSKPLRHTKLPPPRPRRPALTRGQRDPWAEGDTADGSLLPAREQTASADEQNARAASPSFLSKCL